MLLRAVFWIALVSLLMPREPDLGLGRPGAQSLPSQALAWASQKHASVCRDHRGVCSAGVDFLDSFQGVAIRSLAQVKGVDFLDSFQGVAIRSLAQVKVDIEAAQRARGHS